MSDQIHKIRHSLAHIMAAVILKKFPDAKLSIGPVIENGFYYDILLPEKLSETDLPKVQKDMQAIIKSKIAFTKSVAKNKQEALQKVKGNKYKEELVQELSDGEEISFYTSGDFVDLCSGPHVKDTSEINPEAFALTSIAGAYWRGDEKNDMLTRIYGVAFETKEELEKYLAMLEEAKKRDHRKIGKEMDLFVFADEVGPGLPLWTPKGTVIKDQLEKWAHETEAKAGYVRVTTPHIAKHTLYEISGHLPYYKDDMYSPMTIDEEDYYLKGMNCPHHHMIYLARPKSYRDLPLRFAEYGPVYRYEKSGSLFGLMRVRFIEQNDAHIYCTLEQAEEEFLNVLKMHEYYYNTLGLTKDDYHIVIGLPDEKKRDKYHGDKKLWDQAETMMRGAIEKSGIRQSDDVGGAAFYGPKVDFNIISSIGREFSISTNQLDLYMPQRFDLQYTDQKGQKQYCAVIHRAPLGSHERFIGFLIEHFAGNFPLWLSPVQIKILTVSDKHIDFAQKLQAEFLSHNFRVEIDSSSETLGNKIRKNAHERVPYTLVIGDKEMGSDTLAVRVRSQKDLWTIKKSDFITKITDLIKNRSLDLN